MAKNNKKDDPKGFSEGERDALKDLILERRSEKNDESTVLAKIAEMPEPDKSMAQRIHEIVKENAPELSAKTWYGMPAYANKDGKVICFFKTASKYKQRYSDLGFLETANLDEGNMWPDTFAINKLTAAEEKKIAELVKKAVS